MVARELLDVEQTKRDLFGPRHDLSSKGIIFAKQVVEEVFKVKMVVVFV